MRASRPGGPNGLRSIQTLEQASKWSGQSESALLEVIRLLSDPTRQASAAKFVGGALEFRAAPGYYLENGLVPGEMGSDGRFYGSSWRGTSSDNQFLKDPSKDPMLSGPAPFNLPKPQPQTPPTAKTPKEDQNINFSEEEKEKIRRANPEMDPKELEKFLQSSSKRDYINNLAMALKNGRMRPKTNTLIFNNTVKQTEYVAEESGGGNTILISGGLNSSDRRNIYLASV